MFIIYDKDISLIVQTCIISLRKKETNYTFSRMFTHLLILGIRATWSGKSFDYSDAITSLAHLCS